MTHSIAANFTLPTILNTLKPTVSGGITKAMTSAAAKAAAATATPASTAATGLGSTFLSLLVKELQNQDPTAPMDSTAMVGQMISLNQLDQLISINQKTATAATTTPIAHVVAPASAAIAGFGVQSPTAAAAKSQTPYFDPTSMQFNSAAGLNGVGASNMLNPANSPNYPINAAAMGFPGFDNTSGGK